MHMQEEHKHTCIVCGLEKTEGIHIVTQFICDSCEREMVRTDVKDEKYPFYIHQLKQLWIQDNIS
ncbi:hypothetical protein PA598K_06992 [Paenibacillus sp. 598K]|nr:hypothetical protein PA598K_06992 [Paenibacillus sp. 598K]